MDIHQGSGPLGSGPTGPGSCFSVMPFSRRFRNNQLQSNPTLLNGLSFSQVKGFPATPDFDQ